MGNVFGASRPAVDLVNFAASATSLKDACSLEAL